MQITRHDSIFPGARLTCVNTTKFKTACISVTLISGLKRGTAASCALLPRVLRRGCSEFPDNELIAAELDELYGAHIEPFIRKKGELQCIGFYADFLDDRFVPGFEGILEKTAGLLGKILLDPATDGGILRGDYVESEKNTLIDDIRSMINDKGSYSIDRMIALMCSEEAFGVNRYGTEAEAAEISPGSLTKLFHELLKTSKIEIFYCGAAEPERVADVIKKSLLKLPERISITTPETQIITRPVEGPPRRYTEELDVSQGKLALGYRLGIKANSSEKIAELLVFNAIFGAGVSSKLFLNVREKLSLCYYASSMIERHKQIMIVISGVDFNKFDAAENEIMNQLESIKNAEVSEQELNTAKLSVASAIKSAFDRPAGLEDLYLDSSIALIPYDPAELCGSIEKITAEQVISLASNIETDTVFYLTGNNQRAGINSSPGAGALTYGA